jgi:hypothetical protein
MDNVHGGDPYLWAGTASLRPFFVRKTAATALGCLRSPEQEAARASSPEQVRLNHERHERLRERFRKRLIMLAALRRSAM